MLVVNAWQADAGGGRASAPTPPFALTVDVVRMDAELGERAGAVINWTVQRFPDHKMASGHTQVELSTQGGVDSAVAAYQQIVISTAGDIVAVIHTLQASIKPNEQLKKPIADLCGRNLHCFMPSSSYT